MNWGLVLTLTVVGLSLIPTSEARGRRTKEGVDSKEQKKKGRLFSLFNVVTFQNTGCMTADANRRGNCYTIAECANRGGMAAGRCAAGFGVCCVSVISASGSTATENCTYIQNPGHPAAVTTAGAVSYSVRKFDEDVCSLRLDFQMFTIRAAALTTELMDMHNCQDTFIMTTPGATTRVLPVICGDNTGQHVYLDFGAGTDITLAFNLGATPTAVWDIKTSQIQCGATFAPPTGCLQYHTATSGRLTTFNFNNAASTHLPNQDYTICIRKDSNACCIQYNVCQDAGSFSLSSGASMSVLGVTNPVLVAGTEQVRMFNFAAEDTNCFRDYIRISGGQPGCSGGAPIVEYHDRFCGANLHTSSMRGGNNRVTVAPLPTIYNMVNIPVCDCSPPFSVDIITDNLPDTVVAVEDLPGPMFDQIRRTDPALAMLPNTQMSRGVCLDYKQVAC